MTRKLAGAPITWGVSEVPGWGRQLDRDDVLEGIAAAGLTALWIAWLMTTVSSSALALRSGKMRSWLTLPDSFVSIRRMSCSISSR